MGKKKQEGENELSGGGFRASSQAKKSYQTGQCRLAEASALAISSRTAFKGPQVGRPAMTSVLRVACTLSGSIKRKAIGLHVQKRLTPVIPNKPFKFEHLKGQFPFLTVLGKDYILVDVTYEEDSGK